MNEHPDSARDHESPEQLHQQLQAAVEARDTGELAALIREEVGIPAEKQIWREESVWSEAAENG